MPRQKQEPIKLTAVERAKSARARAAMLRETASRALSPNAREWMEKRAQEWDRVADEIIAEGAKASD